MNLSEMPISGYWRVALPAAAALAAAVAFAAYRPLPSYVQDGAVVRFMQASDCLVAPIAKTLNFLGIAKPLQVTQKMVEWMSQAPKSTTYTTFNYRQFADSRTVVATPVDADKRSGAAVVFIHGGGWCIGSPELYSELMDQLVNELGVTVFGIRYRLAPEHPFPAAFDDSLAAVESIFDEAESMGIDRSRIAIAGDSAGGQLTAAIVQHLRMRKSRHRPKAQVLVYPATQVANFRTKSFLENANAVLVDPEFSLKLFSNYLSGSEILCGILARNGHVTQKVQAAFVSAVGEEVPVDTDAESQQSEAASIESKVLDYRVSPLLNPDIDSLELPPSLLIACQFDIVRDDSLMYAKRLERAGAKVELKVYQTYHAALTMPNDGKQIRADLIDFLKRHLV